MKDKKLIIVSGFALFSMLFGAGNLIFPPYLGNKAGDQYLMVMIEFLLNLVGLMFLGLLAATKCGGAVEKIGNTIGPRFSPIFSTIIIFAIGPGLVIPRTAATTVEVIQKGFSKGANSILLVVIFFVCVYLFVRKPSEIIDNLGKILTPLLIVTFLAIILKGIVSPVATPVNTYQIQVFQSSFEEGYQIVDVLASIVFAIVVTKGFMQNGTKNEDKIKDYTIRSATITAIELCFVYGELLFVGATTSNLNLGNMERIELLLYICNQQLGVFRRMLICIAMTLACLTTAIGLTTTVGEFFGDMLKDKTNGIMSYDLIIIISTVFSAFFAVVGVEKILKISAPILSAIYPVAIVLIFLNLFNKDTFEKSTKLGAIIGASIFGFLVLLNNFKLDFGLLKLIELVFPMQIKGFIWIISTVIGGSIGKIKK